MLGGAEAEKMGGWEDERHKGSKLYIERSKKGEGHNEGGRRGDVD